MVLRSRFLLAHAEVKWQRDAQGLGGLALRKQCIPVCIDVVKHHNAVPLPHCEELLEGELTLMAEPAGTRNNAHWHDAQNLPRARSHACAMATKHHSNREREAGPVAAYAMQVEKRKNTLKANGEGRAANQRPAAPPLQPLHHRSQPHFRKSTCNIFDNSKRRDATAHATRRDIARGTDGRHIKKRWALTLDSNGRCAFGRLD